VLSPGANGANDADSVAINVAAVSDGPAVTSPAAGTFAESSAGVVYTATRSDADSGDTVTWTLSGPDAALFTIADISRGSRDLDELFTSLHEIIGQLMDATNFYIAEDDADTDRLDFPIFVDEVDDLPPTSRGEGLTWWVLRTGQAILARPSTVEALVASGEIADIGAPSVDWLGVPLKSGDRIPTLTARKTGNATALVRLLSET
jgi:hypothetical protein